MIDITVLAIVTFAVIVLYVVERYTRNKQIEVLDAAKLGVLSAAITGGVLYTIDGSEVVPTIVEKAQDMFVGKPSF
jgi:hypothetical protein